MTAIKKFKQLFMLETYSKHSYIFEANKAEVLDNLIETNKFIHVSGARINVTNISSYYPIPNNPIYSLVILIPEANRGALLGLIKEYDNPDYSELKERTALNFLRKKFNIPYPNIADYPDKAEGDYLNRDEMRHYVCTFLHTHYPNNV